jgi:hypothetical protein
LNNLFCDGEEILKQIRMEVDQAPFIARKEMNTLFAELSGSWNSFKNNCRSNPGLVMGGPSIADESSAQNFDLNLQLSKGITILERTSDSLYRASQVAKESEQIGTEVLTELGESLLIAIPLSLSLNCFVSFHFRRTTRKSPSHSNQNRLH